jgi:hypothetical protein
MKIEIPSKEYVKLYLFIIAIASFIGVLFFNLTLDDLGNGNIWLSLVPILSLWFAFD